MEAFFRRPTQSNIKWDDIESLFTALEAYIEEREGSRMYVELNDMAGHFHRPHPQERDRKRCGGFSQTVSEGGRDRAMMDCKGYRAVVAYDDEAGIFHGRGGRYSRRDYV